MGSSQSFENGVSDSTGVVDAVSIYEMKVGRVVLRQVGNWINPRVHGDTIDIFNHGKRAIAGTLAERGQVDIAGGIMVSPSAAAIEDNNVRLMRSMQKADSLFDILIAGLAAHR